MNISFLTSSHFIWENKKTGFQIEGSDLTGPVQFQCIRYLSYNLKWSIFSDNLQCFWLHLHDQVGFLHGIYNNNNHYNHNHNYNHNNNYNYNHTQETSWTTKISEFNDPRSISCWNDVISASHLDNLYLGFIKVLLEINIFCLVKKISDINFFGYS